MGAQSYSTASTSTSHSTKLPKSTTTNFVFFPQPLPCVGRDTNTQPGAREGVAARYLYGWVNRGTILVAGSLVAATVDDARAVIERVRSDLVGTKGEELVLLGECCSCSKGKERKTPLVNGKGKARATPPTLLAIHLTTAGSPSLCRLATCGSRSLSESTTLITFIPPIRARLQFLSTLPLLLDLNSFSTGNVQPQAPPEEETDDDKVLWDKMKQSAALDFSRPLVGSRGEVVHLDQVIDWINLSVHLPDLICPPPHTPFLRPTTSRLVSFLSIILFHPLRLLRILSKIILSISNWEIPFLGGPALKDLSATVQQIDTRLSQALAWPSQYSLIRLTLDDSVRSADIDSLRVGRAHYIQFYNTMWLIANDIIVGTAIASFLCENSDYLGRKLGEVLETCTLTFLRDLLLWLNDWPGGVKLNFELASIFCDGFLWGAGLWEEFVFYPVKPHLPSIVYVLGLSGLLGTTMFLSFASDLLSLLTLHIFVIYYLATSIFRWHLSMLSALFNIFRGKKFNVLRNRVEPAAYEVDQLLLGTILFTLAAFLFPTVLAYYLTFAASRVGIVVLHAGMETALAFMNHFPLFAVMLRLKDPSRLPGGIQFELRPASPSTSSHSLLRMTNNPIGLAGIFVEHLQLSRRLASHYSPIYILGRLAAGLSISPIPRVRLRLSVDKERGVRSGRDKETSGRRNKA